MIIFENTLNGFLPAFNNQVLKFKSDSILQSVQATININGNEFIIYALPDGWFRFNFKEVAKTLVNTNNFTDEINPNIPVNGFVYQENNGWFVGSFVIHITFIDGSIEISTQQISLISSVYNLEEFKKGQFPTNISFALLPLVKNSNDRFYVKYWEGYPFDFTYKSELKEVTFVNLNNGLDYVFSINSMFSRIFFSDGSIDETITNVLPISNGLSTIEAIDNDNNESVFLLVDKIPMCNNDGIYIKWFNSKGGYSYWLFNKFYQRSLNSSNIGELENDFYNLDDTISPLVQIGRNGFDNINVKTDLLTDNEFNLLSDIFTSPKIYFFTGAPFARASVQDWIEVELKSTNAILRNWKSQPNEINLSFELPKRNTQSL